MAHDTPTLHGTYDERLRRVEADLYGDPDRPENLSLHQKMDRQGKRIDVVYTVLMGWTGTIILALLTVVGWLIVR